MTPMSKSPSAERQQCLKAQILAAHSEGALDQLDLLCSQWVHRYGVDSLPDLAPASVPIRAEQAEAAPDASATPSSGGLRARLKQSLREVGSSFQDMPSIAPRSEASAPPLSTPQFLRRWLVQNDDDVPKAS